MKKAENWIVAQPFYLCSYRLPSIFKSGAFICVHFNQDINQTAIECEKENCPIKLNHIEEFKIEEEDNSTNGCVKDCSNSDNIREKKQ